MADEFTTSDGAPVEAPDEKGLTRLAEGRLATPHEKAVEDAGGRAVFPNPDLEAAEEETRQRQADFEASEAKNPHVP